MHCSPALAGGLGGVFGSSLSVKIFTTVALSAIGYLGGMFGWATLLGALDSSLDLGHRIAGDGGAK